MFSLFPHSNSLEWEIDEHEIDANIENVENMAAYSSDIHTTVAHENPRQEAADDNSTSATQMAEPTIRKSTRPHQLPFLKDDHCHLIYQVRLVLKQQTHPISKYFSMRNCQLHIRT